MVCQQAHALTDVTFETTFHELASLVSLYVSMTTEKLNALERAMLVTVHEVGEIYHQSLCEGLSAMAGDNSGNDSLFCEKVTMFVDEKAVFSQHFIVKMMTECKHDVKETRTSLLGDILYEFNRGLCQTPKEFIRVSRKEIHDYLDDLEDAYISKCDKAAGEFCLKLLEKIWADFKQKRDSEKNIGAEDVQNIDVNDKYDQLIATGALTKKMVKNRWRGFKKFLCCCRKKKCTEKDQCENGKNN